MSAQKEREVTIRQQKMTITIFKIELESQQQKATELENQALQALIVDLRSRKWTLQTLLVAFSLQSGTLHIGFVSQLKDFRVGQ